MRCDVYGCVAPLVGGGEAALVWDARAFDEDCRRAALVVTRLDAPAACADTAAVVDRRSLAATGALSLTRDGAGFRAKAARDPAGSRPWSPRAAEPPPDEALRLVFAARTPPVPATAEQSFDPTDDAGDEADPVEPAEDQ